MLFSVSSKAPAVYSWLKAISAIGKDNNVIGNGLKLPWHLPNEYKYFLKKTEGHHILYGRVTYRLRNHHKNCKIYVLSKTKKGNEIKGTNKIQYINSINEIEKPPDNKILWVCGGQQVYEKMLPHCFELYLSIINGTYEGSSFFPKYDHLFKEDKVIYQCNEYTTKIFKHI